MLFHFEFGFEVRNACIFVGRTNRTVNEMANALPLRRLDDRRSLLDLIGRVGLHGEYAVHTIHRARQAVGIIEASLKHFLPVPHQLTCFVAIRIPHQHAQLESFLLQMLIHGASLPTGCAYYKNLHCFLPTGPLPLLNLIRIKIAFCCLGEQA